ncbi:cell wall-binding repeat-containing protein [Oxobacter pfennigii]|uniref:cell wall-binding repeat-containing protein n=1 Tax=Oxobacter pfennigii TaxID=36849 RepID=UPI0006D4660E|nr:cell wall-binding repeat-containing protein [Oxobacter pfennigii]
MNRKSNIMRSIYTIMLAAVVAAASIMVPEKAMAAVSERLAGSDRYGTSIKISQAGWESSINVVLATGEDFPDALCAAPLARKLDAPILLSEKWQLRGDIESEIIRLGAKNIYIIGGTGVVSAAVETRLTQKGITVTRLSGNDRYQTSIAVANYMKAQFGLNTEAAVATGADFPDALSIAPIAADKGIPIILSPKAAVTADVSSFIMAAGIQKTYIIGGTGVLSDAVLYSLPGAERISGKDRYETNAAIINRFMADLNFDNPYITTGLNFPDALAGSALAPSTSSPIILADKNMSGVIKDIIKAKLGEIKSVTALGGEGAVPYSVLENLYFNNFRGNSPGNITGGGIAATNGAKIYYANNSFGVVNASGTGKKIFLENDTPMFINIMDDGWIYYFNLSDQGKLYKVYKDGAGRQPLSADMALYINVVGEWIYYSNGLDSNSIYKIKTDGTGRTKLDSGSASELNVVDGHIYYVSGDAEKNIYRINTDGTGKIKLGSDSAGAINVTGDYIYYRNISDNSRIYRIKTDGTGRQLVVSDSTLSLNVEGDTIYYSNNSLDGQLYKVKTDGTSKAEVSSDRPIFINIVGNYIYYIGAQDELLYRINTDGTGRQEVK